MLCNQRDLVGDVVPHIHIHLHNDAINQLGSVQGDIRGVGYLCENRVSEYTVDVLLYSGYYNKY